MKHLIVVTVILMAVQGLYAGYVQPRPEPTTEAPVCGCVCSTLSHEELIKECRISIKERPEFISKIAELERIIESLRGDISKYEQISKADKAEIASLNIRITSLEKQILGLKSDLTKCEKEIYDLKCKIASLENDLNDCKKDKQELIRQINELKQTIRQKESENKTLTDKINELEKLLKKRESELKTCEADKTKCGNDLRELQCESGKYTTDIEATNKNINKEIAEITKLSGSIQKESDTFQKLKVLQYGKVDCGKPECGCH